MPADTFKKVQVAIDGTPTTIYSPPANPPDTAYIIKSILGTNISGMVTTVTLWQGGTADVNRIFGPCTLQAGEWFSGGSGTITIAQGDSLSGQCSQTDGVVITLEGDEVS